MLKGILLLVMLWQMVKILSDFFGSVKEGMIVIMGFRGETPAWDPPFLKNLPFRFSTIFLRIYIFPFLFLEMS